MRPSGVVILVIGIIGLLLAFSVHTSLPASVHAVEVSSSQMFLLQADSMACIHEDDIRMADYYMEREDNKMLLFMLERGKCHFEANPMNVFVVKSHGGHPEWIQVRASKTDRPFWTFAFNLQGYVDNQLLPSLTQRSDFAEKNQVLVRDWLAFRNEKGWQEEAEKLILEKKISQGMTKDQVLRAWGQPLTKETRLQSGGSISIWNYKQDYKVIFSGDVVSEIRTGR